MSLVSRVLSGVTVVAMLVASSAFANLGDTDDAATENPGFLEGKAAIEAQDWSKAIVILKKTAEALPESADVQNFLGYAYRKSGNLQDAFAHYERALKIDPSHKHAHEYVGEAYLMQGDLSGAEKHLAELAKICSPIPCEEYKELKRAVDAYKQK